MIRITMHDGSEKFGIFDRNKSNAPVKATWVMKGIQAAIN